MERIPEYILKSFKVMKLLNDMPGFEEKAQRKICRAEDVIRSLRKKIDSARNKIYHRRYKFDINHEPSMKLRSSYSDKRSEFGTQQEEEVIGFIKGKRFYPVYWTNQDNHFYIFGDGIIFQFVDYPYHVGGPFNVFVPWERIKEVV